MVSISKWSTYKINLISCSFRCMQNSQLSSNQKNISKFRQRWFCKIMECFLRHSSSIDNWKSSFTQVERASNIISWKWTCNHWFLGSKISFMEDIWFTSLITYKSILQFSLTSIPGCWMLEQYPIFNQNLSFKYSFLWIWKYHSVLVIDKQFWIAWFAHKHFIYFICKNSWNQIRIISFVFLLSERSTWY